MLRFIQRPETDPYYNLAAEEYLLKTAQVDTFMTWRNEPSVIIGKHQNALKEIDQSYIEKNNLPVIRRISGGGTVYHDPGNVNFTFIFTNRKENLIDFIEFTRPVILFLQNLGLDASFSGKNNITIEGLKVSGNSAHLYKNKVLYHGTLLFDSDLDILDRAIAGHEELFNDKAVRSIRSKVTNIRGLLANDISTEDFISQFKKFIFHYYKDIYEDKLDESDEAEIKKMVEAKYHSYQWNYGYSPDYEFNNRWINNGDEYSVSLKVTDGIIREAELSGPETVSAFLKIIARVMIGSYHERDSIKKIIKHPFINGKNDEHIMNQITVHLFR